MCAPTAGSITARWESNGYVCLPSLLDPASLGPALAEAEHALTAHSSRGAGVRNALRWPALRYLAGSPALTRLTHSLLGPHAFITRAILFDKSPGANWEVGWHQDTTIAVETRLDVPGFDPWSVKSGVPHVQPPAEVLERMATVRVHFDACGQENGALLVVPGSRRTGILANVDPSDCDRRTARCAVLPGGVVAMRPLLLHASRRSESPSRRRVLHLELAVDPLPGGLGWARA